MNYKYRVSVEKACAEDYEEYVKLFANSAIDKHYFKDSNLLGELICKGLENDSILAAKTANGEIVGLLIYDLTKSFPCLTLIGVKEAFRGKHIGDQLIDIFLGIAKESGVDDCFVCVSDFNPRAKALFVKKGFKPEKLVPDLYKKGESEWLLMKKI